MKLRVKSNSIRYRLTKSDVADLSTKGILTEKVNFGENQFVYELQITDQQELTAAFKDSTITLYKPSAMLNELAETDKVGFESNTSTLHLLVEKDFTCLDNVEEDQSDNYPNPLAIQNHERD